MSTRRMPRTAAIPRVPTPAAPPDAGTVPASITFFLPAAQRRAVLAALKEHHSDRTAALLAALRIKHTPGGTA